MLNKYCVCIYTWWTYRYYTEYGEKYFAASHYGDGGSSVLFLYVPVL